MNNTRNKFLGFGCLLIILATCACVGIVVISGLMHRSLMTETFTDRLQETSKFATYLNEYFETNGRIAAAESDFETQAAEQNLPVGIPLVQWRLVSDEHCGDGAANVECTVEEESGLQTVYFDEKCHPDTQTADDCISAFVQFYTTQKAQLSFQYGRVLCNRWMAFSNETAALAGNWSCVERDATFWSTLMLGVDLNTIK